MNTKPVKATGLLVLVFGVTAAGAQNASGDLAASAVKKSEQQFKLCATNEKTESAERTMLETYSSPALKKATLSSKSFWDFITDPSTPYMDRLAAANRGGSMLSPEELLCSGHYLTRSINSIAPAGARTLPSWIT